MSDRNLEQSDFSPSQETRKAIAVKWAYRWEVFRRLKALEIDCQCSTNEPLLVNLDSPTTLVQLWSVIRHTNAERQRLINWLNDCWQVKYDCQSR
ncbi:MAG: Asr1405/Asl0597 family protein [Cyanobacteria bacterium J06621_12]